MSYEHADWQERRKFFQKLDHNLLSACFRLFLIIAIHD